MYTFFSLSLTSDFNLNQDIPICRDLLFDLVQLMERQESVEDGVVKIFMSPLQQNTAKFRQLLDTVVAKYSPYEPRAHKFSEYFRKLNDNEYFIFIPTESLTEEAKQRYRFELSGLESGRDPLVLESEFKAEFGSLLDKYVLKGKDENIKQSIGEKDKNLRVCRFCGRSAPEVSFKTIAHAISESLGNKKIILNEECDACNAGFGSASGIERSLNVYLKPYITFFGVKGKKKIPKLKGEDFDLAFLTDSGDRTPIPGDQTDEELTEQEKNFTISERITMQDVYRTLVKFVMSIVDADELDSYRETIAWVNREITAAKLPKIAILKSDDWIKSHPTMLYYIRKDDDQTLPFAVGEFHFTLLKIVFIIPFTKGSERDFCDPADYQHFWSSFKHYGNYKGWEFKNMSEASETDFQIHIKFNPAKAKETGPVNSLSADGGE